MDSFRARRRGTFKCMRIAEALVVLCVIAGMTSAGAQSAGRQSADELAFEVVSIKPVARPIPLVVGGVCLFQAGTRYRCPAITVRQLLSGAFRIGDSPWPQSQITGGPDWIGTSQFEIEATLNNAVEQDQREGLIRRLPPLWRQLLEDRFNLETHIERRPVPVYALAKAFEDGRLGPQLREATTTCPPFPNGTTSVPPARAGGPIEKPCWGGSFRRGEIRSGRITMTALAAMLTNQSFADRIVLDRTDLIGNFEVDLRWSPTPVVAAVERPGTPRPDLLDQPSLFTAVEEQLGLKLEPRTELMDVLVVDHVQLPTPN